LLTDFFGAKLAGKPISERGQRWKNGIRVFGNLAGSQQQHLPSCLMPDCSHCKPPGGLTAAMRPGWFAGSENMLEMFCRSVVLERRLAAGPRNSMIRGMRAFAI
jgi:hypothetical protein